MAIGATLTERLAIIIDAHTDGAVSSIRKLSLEEQAAAERAQVLQAKITDLEASMSRSRTPGGTAAQQVRLSRLSNEYKGLTATLGNVPAAASRAERALSRIGAGGLIPQSALSAIGKAGPGLVAGAAVLAGFEFIKSGITDYENLADAIRQVQQASGASVEDASKVVAITHALGVESDTAALGLFRLGKNIDLQPQRLTNYGIAIAHTKQGTTDLVGTLFNVATAYQKTEDPARRAAIVYEAFGRAGTTMLPILNANRKQLEEIAKEAGKQGRIFNQGDLDRARAYQIEVRELQTSFQSLAISAGRAVLPALTKVAGALTQVSDAAHSNAAKTFFNIDKYANPYYDTYRLVKLTGILGHGSGDAAKAAADAIQSQQDQATQDALSQAALGTLASGTDVLAEKQNVASAKKTLADAKSSLADAVTARQKAIRDLAAAQAKGSSSTAASQVEAANARITAAEAALRTAEYTGGDQRIASAKSSLASAQAALNRLRGTGADATNRLADATDRLHKANKAVADQQKAVHDAQKAANDATGLNAREALGRLRAQAQDQGRLASANLTLAAKGASTDTLAYLDKLNQQLPGTLVKVAHTLSRGTLVALNQQEDTLGLAQQTFASAAADPTIFQPAGVKAGDAFVSGFTGRVEQALGKFGRGLGGTGHPGNPLASLLYGTPGKRAPHPSSGLDLLTPPITVQGDLVVKGHNAREVARNVSRDNRLRALGTG